MQVTILGCGGSDGVPRLGGPDGKGDWGACDPHNPRNRRTRVSALVETDGVSLLIDTAPDLRDQALANRVRRVDAVLYTHDHADHSHGIHELRRFAAIGGEGEIPVYADPLTLSALQVRFAYAFGGDDDSPYMPILRGHPFEGPFTVAGVPVTPFPQDHGFGQISYGFRIGDFAYSTDVFEFPGAAREVLTGLALWVVDCQQYDWHPTHSYLDKTLDWIADYGPGRAVLTHMGPDMDYETVRRRCPPGVEPGYDGMVIAL